MERGLRGDAANVTAGEPGIGAAIGRVPAQVGDVPVIFDHRAPIAEPLDRLTRGDRTRRRFDLCRSQGGPT